ncbi:helix-turn-helix domain-containing protein [Streptomyces hygroscopicus]|uniref:helix-turn-helix domain-containing protein n=1 Tax=Streptomyces hygroscopicus TaxID=1912 RepID=UPI0007DB2C2E|nr:helix-turn-helix transcriptional regulator [Streptomyces sp. NBRC 109436]
MDSGEFCQRVREVLHERGMSVRAAARTLNYDPAYLSRVLSGKQRPSAQLIAGLDELLQVDRESSAPDASVSLIRVANGEEYAHAIRETSRRLVIFDNDLGGLPIADAATRAFRTVYRRLGSGNYDRKYERDIQSAAAELAEVAGWTLYDAEKHDAARRLNQEALFLAQLSGDRSIELLILQNMAMHSGWLGRHREELAIARSVIEGSRLSPRVEAIFRVREAKGLAGAGDHTGAARSFDHARSLLGDGVHDGDPSWSWWISANEIDGHHGSALQEACQFGDGIQFLQRALWQTSGARWVGYRSISAARLLDCFLSVNAWRDAEELACSIVTSVDEIGSARTVTLLRTAIRRAQMADKTPSGVRDVLEHLGSAMASDPFTL